VLGDLADVERDLIRTRTAEGTSRAKAQGKHMGRSSTLNPSQQKEATPATARAATLCEFAESYNVGIPRSATPPVRHDRGLNLFGAIDSQRTPD